MSRSPSVREPLLSESKSESGAVSASVAVATAVMKKYHNKDYSDVLYDIRRFCQANEGEELRRAFVSELFRRGLSLPVTPGACTATDIGLLAYRYEPRKPSRASKFCACLCFKSMAPVGDVECVAADMKPLIAEGRQGSGVCAIFTSTEYYVAPLHERLQKLGGSALLDDLNRLIKCGGVNLEGWRKQIKGSHPHVMYT